MMSMPTGRQTRTTAGTFPTLAAAAAAAGSRSLLVGDVEPASDKRFELLQHFGGLRAGGGHDEPGAADGLERHERHDGLSADNISVLLDLNFGVEPRGDLRKNQR